MKKDKIDWADGLVERMINWQESNSAGDKATADKFEVPLTGYRAAKGYWRKRIKKTKAKAKTIKRKYTKRLNTLDFKDIPVAQPKSTKLAVIVGDSSQVKQLLEGLWE